MAIRTTRWTPDTCPVSPGCVITYTWDDTQAESVRTHSAGSVIQQCSFHAGLTLPQLYAALTDENPRKNKLVDYVINNFPALTMVDAQGQTVLDPAKITWRFVNNAGVRQLVVTIPSLTTNQRNNLQAQADARVGAGKVVIQ